MEAKLSVGQAPIEDDDESSRRARHPGPGAGRRHDALVLLAGGGASANGRVPSRRASHPGSRWSVAGLAGRRFRRARVISGRRETICRDVERTLLDDSGAPIRTRGRPESVAWSWSFATSPAKKRERVRRVILAKAGEALVSSIDYQSTLATVARFAVPTLADWTLQAGFGGGGGASLSEWSSVEIKSAPVGHTSPAPKIR